LQTTSKSTVVPNTGPLIALAGIDHLDLLRELFAAVIVPHAVHQEVLAGGSFAVGLPAYKRAHWLKVAEPVKADAMLLALLDEGEAAVISLARARGIDRVLIDEQKARRIARTVYNLNVKGSVWVLIHAKQQGLLGSVGDAIQAMRDNGYWIHDHIMHHALKAAGEAEQ
jgi:predicted nucleic acid-binding protein